jgi:hypothetical protein
VLLLVTGGADFVCFDLSDPNAPMNEAGGPGCQKLVQSGGCTEGPESAQASALFDDGCIGCGIGFVIEPGFVTPDSLIHPISIRFSRIETLGSPETPDPPPKA